MRGKYSYLLITLIVLAADQATKAWATASLKPVGSIEVIPDLFRLSYALNRGVAFSLLADSKFDIRWVLASISAAAALMVLGYMTRTGVWQTRLNASLALLLSGIIGNLIDRVRLGEVVDFLDFHLAERFTWPTFNIADAAICIGAAILAFELFREEREAERSRQHAPATEEGGFGSD